MLLVSFCCAVVAETDDAFALQPYIGARGGYALISESCYEDYQTCNNDNFGYGLFGGVQLDSHWAMELSATDYQDYQAQYPGNQETAEMVGYGLSIKWTQPLWKDLSGYLRIGTSYLEIRRQSSFAVDNLRGWSGEGALGGVYVLSPHWSMRLEYQYLENVSQSQGHFTSLGVQYFFNKTSLRNNLQRSGGSEDLRRPARRVGGRADIYKNKYIYIYIYI